MPSLLKEFGRDLKYLRESKNITLAEISAETRINQKFFLNFESGVFDFQPETYIRSFLREYAKVIGENEYEILHDYEKAKSGFYSSKNIYKEELNQEEGFNSNSDVITEDRGQKDSYETEKVLREEKQNLAADRNIPLFNSGPSPKKRGPSKKIFLIILILIFVAGIYFLIDYLNKSPNQKQGNDVRPKSFSEISEEYESKIKGKTENEDSLKKIVEHEKVIKTDSLILTVKSSKEVRIKVYLDENKLVEEVIKAKDSLSLKAKEEFRFSASANSSVNLYLNGVLLKKPKNLTGTSIKNLIVKKNGIVSN